MPEGTGSENRDAHLRSADFFNVETYSEIQYVSNVDLGSYIGSGDLTIRDMTKTVAIPLEFELSLIKSLVDEVPADSSETAVQDGASTEAQEAAQPTLEAPESVSTTPRADETDPPAPKVPESATSVAPHAGPAGTESLSRRRSSPPELRLTTLRTKLTRPSSRIRSHPEARSERSSASAEVRALPLTSAAQLASVAPLVSVARHSSPHRG